MPIEDITEYTAYFDPKYAEQLMSESISDEDLPSMSLPRKGPGTEAPEEVVRHKRRRKVIQTCAEAPERFRRTIENNGGNHRTASETTARSHRRRHDGMQEGPCGSERRPRRRRSRAAQARYCLAASKKASRVTKQGVIGTYIHPGAQLGVMVEVNCESDFVARTDDFQELVHDIAMQIAAADPQFVRKEDVTQEALEKRKKFSAPAPLNEGKPEKMLDKIVEGRMAKYYEEVCLLRAALHQGKHHHHRQMIETKIAKLGENIAVARFVRFKVGDATHRLGRDTARRARNRG